ncbi:MAG TPA: Uma2 family endonuclease [Isosphaeraceae bacterium]|nr:Uma2 family endonuclease [Isosphaeraceae bacterium]
MSTALATEAHYTPEDLLALPDEERYELVGGRLVERNMGAESSWVEGRVYSRLDQFCEDHHLGIVWPASNGYQCFPHNPDLVRRPDVSFVRHGRLPGDVVPKGWVKIPPDLAVEVVSPKDRVYDLDEKLADYRKVHIPLVWVINPESRTVTVYRIDGSIRLLFEDDELSGEDIIPGFRCPIREILPPREPTEPAQPTSAGPDVPK